MNIGEKRVETMAPAAVQGGNQAWWSEYPMAYDWRGEITDERFSRAWFDKIDASFLYGVRLFATEQRPFDRIIPLDLVAGKKVLEIGCGMGLHSETLVRAGADLTSIDLAPTSIEATTKRLALKGLKATVQQADAEALPFEDKTFDFVWSWGVIHHSSRTARIVREIARVLKPDGQARVMVYNRLGTSARIVFWRDHVIKFGFLRRSYEETLYKYTDGFSARYYTQEQFEDLFRAFFKNVSSEICGLDVDALPLPNRLRRMAVKFAPEGWLRRRQARKGGFIFLTASNPG